MRRIKVSGYIDVDDEEFDPGPHGPLTEEAYLRYSSELGLDDVTFADSGETTEPATVHELGRLKSE